MKGTEKQIKWAQDIITTAQAQVDGMIDRAKVHPNGFFDPVEKAAAYATADRFAQLLAHPKLQDAGWIIENRNRIGTSINVARDELLNKFITAWEALTDERRAELLAVGNPDEYRFDKAM